MPTTKVAPVEFFFDVGSPYTYLASTQIEALEKRVNRPFRWRPFLLGAVFKAVGYGGPAANGPVKMQHMAIDVLRWAELYRVPMAMPSRFPLATTRAQRCILAAGERHGEPTMRKVAHAVFRAFWVHDLDISDPAELSRILTSTGVPAALLDETELPEIKDALRSHTDEAIQRGAFGAPTFFAKDAAGDHMFFGNDRLELLERHLVPQPPPSSRPQHPAA